MAVGRSYRVSDFKAPKLLACPTHAVAVTRLQRLAATRRSAANILKTRPEENTVFKGIHEQKGSERSFVECAGCDCSNQRETLDIAVHTEVYLQSVQTQLVDE